MGYGRIRSNAAVCFLRLLENLKRAQRERKWRKSAKFFKFELVFWKNAVYIRKSSLMLDLNAQTKVMRLIEKFEKTLKIDLTNTLKCGILRNVASFRGLLLMSSSADQTSKKFEKKLIIRLDKREKLWYIKQPSNSSRVWQLIENWIVRCEPWNSLENSNLSILKKS